MFDCKQTAVPLVKRHLITARIKKLSLADKCATLSKNIPISEAVMLLLI